MLLRTLIALFIGCFISVAQAQTYKLASGDFPPFTGEKVANGGLATEIIVKVINELGDQSDIKFLPWKRGFKKTLEGEYFGTFAYSKNNERLKTWFYSEPLYTLEEVFIVQGDSTFSFSTDYDLRGKTVCKPAGYNLFGLKKMAESGIIKIEQPPNMKHCFRMLSAGRVDMVMTNSKTAQSLIEAETNNLFKYKVLETPFVTIGHHLIIPRSNANGEAFLERFNATLVRFKHSGKIDALIKSYF